MQSSIVHFSELDNRYDADYYDPYYLEKERTLEEADVDITRLSSLTEQITDGSHQTPTYVEEGVKFLSSGNIQEFHIDSEDIKYISPEEHERLRRTQVRPGDVLIAKSGRIGTAAVAPSDFGECNLYEGVALVRTNTQLNPYFLAAYLNSPYGQSQIMRSKKGVSQPHLHLEEIEEIEIPTIDQSKQEEIEELVKESRQLLSKSVNLLQQSVLQLEQLLGVARKYDDELTYNTSFSSLSIDTRLDAEYYQPKYRSLLTEMKAKGYELTTIKDADQFTLSNEKVKPSDQPSKQIQYVTIGDVDSQLGEIAEFEELPGHEAPSRARMFIRENDVLVPYLRDSAESVALVSEKEDEFVATTGFYVIRSEEALPEYLFALMRSKVVQLQMDQRESGVRLTSVNKTAFKRILVPVVDKEDQAELANIVETSLSKKQKSRELVNEVKQEIEKAVKSQ